MNRKCAAKTNIKYLAVACVFFLTIAATLWIASAEDQNYTGCLDKKGDLSNVKIGNEPTKHCDEKETQVSWNSVGPQGPPGVSAWERVSATGPTDTNTQKAITVSCTGSKKLLGGGASVSLADGDAVIVASYPSADNTWTASAANAFSDTWSITAYAICANVTI
jgi:hypothetical protein